MPNLGSAHPYSGGESSYQSTECEMLFRVGDHRSNILNAWHKGTDPLLDTGMACFTADSELDPAERRTLVQNLPFNASTFSKFVSIGADKRLYEPAIRDELPPKFTALYLLSQLTEQEFKALVEERLLTCRLRRGDLERWKKERQGPIPTPPRIIRYCNWLCNCSCGRSIGSAYPSQYLRV